MSSDNLSGSVFTFILGVGIGAAAALLFAPKAGEDLRNDIADGIGDGIGQFQRSAKDLKRRGQKLVNVAKDEVSDAVEAATDAFASHAKRS